MSAVDTSAAEVERMASFLGDPHRRSAWATGDTFEACSATLRALLAERDAALAKVAALEADLQYASAYAENLAARLSAIDIMGRAP
jgi:hypothetical protein